MVSSSSCCWGIPSLISEHTSNAEWRHPAWWIELLDSWPFHWQVLLERNTYTCTYAHTPYQFCSFTDTDWYSHTYQLYSVYVLVLFKVGLMAERVDQEAGHIRSHLLCWEEFMLSLVSFFPFSLILSQIFPVIMRWWQITDPPIKTKWCSTWHPMLLTKVSSCICHLFSKVQRQLKYQNGKCSVHRSELKALVNQI